MAVKELTVIGPGDIVEKAGRSTGLTQGLVNGWPLQLWENGRITKELCVIHDHHLSFAVAGDAGGCVLRQGADHRYRAGGQIIGQNAQFHDVNLWTPMHTLVEDAASKIAGVMWDDNCVDNLTMIPPSSYSF